MITKHDAGVIFLWLLSPVASHDHKGLMRLGKKAFLPLTLSTNDASNYVRVAGEDVGHVHALGLEKSNFVPRRKNNGDWQVESLPPSPNCDLTDIYD